MNVALPKAIQDQLDQVEEMDKAMAAQASQGQTEPESEPTSEVVVVPETVQTDSAPIPVAGPEEDLGWQRRFITLQGKYDAEVPRLYEQLREQKVALQQLTFELQQAKTKSPEPITQTEVTNEDETVFGSDLIDLARRVAREEYQKQYPGVRSEIDRELIPLRQQVGTLTETQVASAEDKYWSTIDGSVPDWETINGNPAWLSWLAEYDPVAGRTRQQGLDEALQHKDAIRTIAFFDAWKSTQASKPESSRMDKVQQELSRQVTPSKSKGGTPVPAGERMWSQADYEAAFDHRKYVGMTPEQIEALQGEADRADAEGRVRWA